jgi:methionine-rich copper-binding protein CopC
MARPEQMRDALNRGRPRIHPRSTMHAPDGASQEGDTTMSRLFRGLAAGCALALLATGPALAHTRLVASTPAANATVSSPRTITLTFNERLVPAFSKFELSMPAHDMKIPLETVVSRDGKRMVGTVSSPLMKGTYRITWTAAGSDGHRMTGTVNFRVG